MLHPGLQLGLLSHLAAEQFAESRVPQLCSTQEKGGDEGGDGEGQINPQIRVRHDLPGLKLFLSLGTVLRHLTCIISFHPLCCQKIISEDKTEI